MFFHHIHGVGMSMIYTANCSDAENPMDLVIHVY